MFMDERMRSTVQELEHTLRRLIDQNEQLLRLTQQKRAALRDGDTERMSRLCEQENEKVQSISETEKHRLQLMAHLTSALNATAERPLRLRELAAYLPEPERGRLLARRQQLRERLESIQAQTNVARRATESLMTHVEGMLRTLTTLASQAATYDRAGTPPADGPAISTINVQG
jgi:vacuolar-type H+-ATPase subunit I/STV1